MGGGTLGAVWQMKANVAGDGHKPGIRIQVREDEPTRT